MNLSLATTGTILFVLFPALAATQRPAPRPAPAPAPAPVSRPAPAPAPAPAPRKADTGRAPTAPRGGTTPAPTSGRSGEDAVPRKPRDAEETPEQIAAEYFRTSDYDGNGWITLAEGQAALALDRTTLAVYDTDRDGRISAEEFTTRYLLVKSRGGAFAPPVPLVDPRKVKKRTQDEVLAAFDDDANLALDLRELGRALKEYGINGLDPNKVLDAFDDNGSLALEPNEMPGLLDVLMPPSVGERGKTAGTLEELFDRYEERETTADTTPQPTRIVGPVSTFRRLDADASGGISIADLEYLQRPLHLDVRVGAVVATLDADGDGQISPEEFSAAMR